MSIKKSFRKRLNCCLSIVIISVLVNEWLVYILMPWVYWPHLSNVPSESVKLLVVGDPQLLGEHFTSSGVFGYVARWDSDRFIAKTFRFAYNYLNPEIVIFLGDILDEGEIADDDEFFRYLTRFKNVFHLVDFNKSIVLPGDNDIGGENEPPSIENEKRFDKYFKNDDLIQYKFLEFVKVNFMTQSNDFLLIQNPPEGMYRIVLSHMPLTPMYSSFAQKVLLHLQPHVILTAHEHTSTHLVSDRKSGIRTFTETSFSRKSKHIFNLTEFETQEMMIPTCSYRMGTDKMGYGAVIISSSGELTYTVLWLPSRFLYLFLYLVVCAIVFLGLLPFRIWSKMDSIIFRRESAPLLLYGKRI